MVATSRTPVAIAVPVIAVFAHLAVMGAAGPPRFPCASVSTSRSTAGTASPRALVDPALMPVLVGGVALFVAELGKAR